jgi:hypothetical protein
MYLLLANIYSRLSTMLLLLATMYFLLATMYSHLTTMYLLLATKYCIKRQLFQLLPKYPHKFSSLRISPHSPFTYTNT